MVKIKYVKRHKCIRKMYRLLTSTGYIDCTEDHSLIIKGKTVNPKDLKVGDILESIEMPSFSNKIDFNKKFAWLLGFFVADGNFQTFKKSEIYTQKNIVFTNCDTNKLIKTKEILNSLGVDSTITEVKIGHKGAYNKKRIYKLRTCGTNRMALEGFFEQCYLNNVKTIPSFVYDFSKESRLNFLNGFLDGDGCYVKNRKNTYKISQKNACVINGICYLSKDIWNYTLNYVTNNKGTVYFKLNINETSVRKIAKNVIKKIYSYDYDGFVYDIETENHHFCGGIGNINLHNSFFYEAKKQKVKIGFTKFFYGDYKGEKYKQGDSSYAKLRRRNMEIGRQRLFKKYNLKSWIKYIHLERKNQ